MPRPRLLAACAVAAVLLGEAGPRGQAPSPADAIPESVSAAILGAAPFTQTELSSLRAGQVVTRTDSSPENLEASVATAVKIATTRDRAADYLHLLISYVDGQVTVSRGVFSTPPVEADVARLNLDTGDVSDLNACQPELCDIRVAGATPVEIIDAVQAHRTDTPEHASAWVREALVPYVADYLARGHLALAAHDDRGVRVDLPVEWQALFVRSSLLRAIAAPVADYLSGSTQRLPSGAVQEIYWDKQRYTGLKPVVGATQMVTWRDPDRPDRTVIAQKQFFASHYFYASLAATLIEQDPAAPTPTTYVLYTNRIRGELLRSAQPTRQPGLRGRVSALTANVQRRLGETLIKQSAEQLLTSMKQQLER